MGLMVPHITSLTIVYSTVYSDADQRKHQSAASLAFVRRIHRVPVNSSHKWPVTRKMFPFDEVIMFIAQNRISWHSRWWLPSEVACSNKSNKEYEHGIIICSMVQHSLVLQSKLSSWRSLERRRDGRLREGTGGQVSRNGRQATSRYEADFRVPRYQMRKHL